MTKKTVSIAPKEAKEEKNVEGTQKYSYEDLQEICGKLAAENKYLKENLIKADETIKQLSFSLTAKRLDYLFKVIEYKGSFSKEFVFECAKEIEDTLKIEDEEDLSSKGEAKE